VATRETRLEDPCEIVSDSPGRLAAGIGIVVAALLALTACDPTPIEHCQSTDDIHVICGFHKPEDLAVLPGTPWLLISELGNLTSPGHVAALRLTDQRVVRLRAADPIMADSSSFPRCGPPPSEISPLGFHLRRGRDGIARLLLVNAGSNSRIERYRVTTNDEVPELAWEGCVSVPDNVNPNDVAGLHNDGFVVSHMYSPPRNMLMTVKLLLRLDTGYVVSWQPDKGWKKVPGTDAALPNGVETDPLTGRIFVAPTYEESLIAVDQDGGNARSTRISVQSDNLTWAPDGRLLAVGHTGVPFFGTNGCRNMGDTACSFPFAVVAIDPLTLGVETIYEHADGLIPGPSVALWRGDSLYLGTFFGDRVSRVAIRTDPL
jgi:hypothetical protein